MAVYSPTTHLCEDLDLPFALLLPRLLARVTRGRPLRLADLVCRRPLERRRTLGVLVLVDGAAEALVTSKGGWGGDGREVEGSEGGRRGVEGSEGNEGE